MAQTMATVYSCEPLGADEEDEDDFGVTGFRVIFSYSVAGDRFSGEFFSPRRMTKNQTFTLTYDPDHPERNEHTEAEDEDTRLIFRITIGVIVAIVVLFGLVYFFMK
jgi:hypothetical protein